MHANRMSAKPNRFSGSSGLIQVVCTTLLATPVVAQEFLSLTFEGRPDSATVDLLEEVVDFPVTELLNDVNLYGYTSRVVPIDPNADQQLVDDIVDMLRSPMLSNGETHLERTSEALQVSVGLPPQTVIDHATDGSCVGEPQDWPFSVNNVKQVLAFGVSVLNELDLPLDRANIFVVDSGLSRSLLENPKMRRMLWVNRAEALAGGTFFRNSALQIGCSDPDANSFSVQFGFIPRLDHKSECRAADPFGSIDPPVPTKSVSNYEPAHGGFVTALAAGGPGLIEQMSGLDAFVAVTMARDVRRQVSDEGEVRIASDIIDVMDATIYAAESGAEVLNLSLSIPSDATANADDWIRPLRAYANSGGLIVVAAGNGGFEIGGSGGPDDSLPDTATLPLAVARNGGIDRAIVVGGTQSGADGVPERYVESNWSSELVDIAAPATGVLSFDMTGRLACLPGTSVSTPQVSFVAATLFSLGLWSADEVKRRILATSKVIPELTTRVRGGRVLDVERALDVFVDLIWLSGQSEPIRARLLDSQGKPIGHMIKVCEEASGWVDSRRLLLWQRLPDGRAQLWAEMDHLGADITPLNNTCKAGSGLVQFRNLKSGEVSTNVSLDEIDRVVPSRFRVGEEVFRLTFGK